MQIPQRRDEKLTVRDTSPVYLTQPAIDELREKLERLKASIASLAERAKVAADYGDRSENAEYKEAKSRLRGTHRKILRITDQLKRAVAIKPGSTSKVQIGSTVVLETTPPSSPSSPRASRGATMTFQIVGPDETDPSKGRISFKSPLGSALLGKKSGATVSVPTPSGPQQYKILEIR